MTYDDLAAWAALFQAHRTEGPCGDTCLLHDDYTAAATAAASNGAPWPHPPLWRQLTKEGIRCPQIWRGEVRAIRLNSLINTSGTCQHGEGYQTGQLSLLDDIRIGEKEGERVYIETARILGTTYVRQQLHEGAPEVAVTLLMVTARAVWQYVRFDQEHTVDEVVVVLVDETGRTYVPARYGFRWLVS